MTDDDFDNFAGRLAALAELFDATLTPAKTLLYFEALKDLELEDVVTGFSLAARGCKFMPRPAEVRGFVIPDDADAAETAWLEYKRLARQIGGYISPTFEDAALADTLLAVFGAWTTACWIDLSPEMWASKRKEFDRVYRVMRQRMPDGAKALRGFCEIENTRTGFNGTGLTKGPT